MRNIKDGGSYDLIVVGGGISGVCCAITAAREGLRCLLVEREGCLGGTACLSGVMQLLGGRWYDPTGDCMKRVVGGLFDEITDELIAEGTAIDPDSVDVHHYNPYGWYPRMAAGIPCDVDRLKYHLEKKCLDAGVTIRCYTTVVDLETKQNRITKILAHDMGGWTTFSASLFADCSGDADIAFMAGCPTEKGRKEDGGLCPATTIFYVDGVDTAAYVAYQNAKQSPKLVEIIEALKAQGKWPYKFEIFIAIETPHPGRMMINTIRQTSVDGTDAQSMTQAGIEGRTMAYQLFDIMKTHFPGFAHAHVSRIFDRVGIRETRRIVPRHLLTLQNALDGMHYNDCVATTTYNFDLPDPQRPSYDAMMGDVKRPNAVRKHVRIEIPYGALLPQQIDNLIVAGRCLGAEREVMGACRVMGPCAGMGQAAGNAAALALQDGCYVLVSVNKLRMKLIEQGCIGL